MNFTHFSRNGEILPLDQAVVPLSNIEYSYGYGVYETIRVAKSLPYFLEDHCRRLMESAETIGLEHNFTQEFVQNSIRELLDHMNVEACNVKVLLIGASTAEAATLYVICLNPLFPDRKLYKNGVSCITRTYEREYPHAKTLNMLPSYLAYRDAKRAGAYDALLINRHGHIVEGTRTNFYAIKDQTIYSPPEAEILLGVTRDKVLKVARDAGFQVIEQSLPLTEITNYDGAFLTSTSSKIMPIKTIGDQSWEQIPASLIDLMKAFDGFLKDYTA